jgi:hypothetical protein
MHLPDLMIRASVDSDREMRIIAALSPHTPSQVLADLKNDRSRNVRVAVSTNRAAYNHIDTTTEITQ